MSSKATWQAEDNLSRPPIITDHPLNSLVQWHNEGQRVALTTLIGIDGAAPRPLGAQMVISESGRAAGYLSGGCLEQALVVEAQNAIAKGKNKLLRFGEGSPFLDIKLPCESGLDVYINQDLTDNTIQTLSSSIETRQPFLLNIDLKEHISTLHPIVKGSPTPSFERTETHFRGTYTPQTKLLIFGAGPTAQRLATLATQSGLLAEFYSPEFDRIDATQIGDAKLYPLSTPTNIPSLHSDPWSAAILAFHDHRWELALLEHLLNSDCFYIGAIGNKKVTDDRLSALKEKGHTDQELARIKNSAGLIKGAKQADTLALGIIAEILCTPH